MDEMKSFPDLALGLLRIHRAITRGLTVSAAGGDEFIQEGFPDPGVRKGYTDYVQSLGEVLAAHHLAEDEVEFPKLMEKLPDAPYDRLASDHREIDRFLRTLRKAASDIAEDGDAGDLNLLVDTLRRITTIWTPHIRVEEEHFSHDNIYRSMSLEDQGLLSMRMGKHNQEHIASPSLAIPFVLYNLEPADRAEMARTMPSNIVNELIPTAWKEQWAPMKPFLLE
jgi:hemerythrin-like domain-containing protein